MVTGRGRFDKRYEAKGGLEISASTSTDDARLWGWIRESEVILPRLQTMVKNDGRRPGFHALLLALEDLGRRVEKLEGEVLRLCDERARP